MVVSEEASGGKTCVKKIDLTVENDTVVGRNVIIEKV